MQRDCVSEISYIFFGKMATRKLGLFVQSLRSFCGVNMANKAALADCKTTARNVFHHFESGI